ncbi:MAG: Uncharacterised protein [Candidatus Poseidoniaceae archaeon]|nr:MAG: Uncharacterised protein [Candidatus Poseidoniaceae archaeon]
MAGSRRIVACLLLGLFASSTIAAPVVADVEWERDGWLTTALADERLASGDEFGCYGVPGYSWYNDPGAVAKECRSYIENNTEASKWGDNALSSYAPDGLTMAQHNYIASQDFVVHGDETGLTESAWHDAEDVPYDVWDWFNIGRRGGSLEKEIGSLETVQNAVEEGGLVNLYWIGRVNDATIRHDRDIADYLQNDAQAWMTTWGQAWSYWTANRCFEHSKDLDQEASTFTFSSIVTEQCTSLAPNAWNVPVTWRLSFENATVVDVQDILGQSMKNLTGERQTAEGWRMDGEDLLVSVRRGTIVTVVLDGENISFDVHNQTQFWNGYDAAVTIAAHDTTDLFLWSKRFDDEDQLRFTWLVSPRTIEGRLPWLPYAALVAGVVTIVAMMGILGREGIGPLAGFMQDKNILYEEE